MKNNYSLNWKTHLLFLGPLGSTFLIALIYKLLGCSEYVESSSETCIQISQILNFDIEYILTILLLLTTLISCVFTPVALIIYIKIFIEFVYSRVIRKNVNLTSHSRGTPNGAP